MHSIRIGDITGWQYLEPDETVEVVTAGSLAKVTVNTSHPTIFSAVTEDGGEMTFLASVHGMATLQFRSRAAVHLVAERPIVKKGEVQPVVVFRSADVGERVEKPAVFKRTFTKMIERVKRNPEFERMLMMSQLNAERLVAMQKAEHDEQIAILKERIDQNDRVNAATANNAAPEGTPQNEQSEAPANPPSEGREASNPDGGS